MGTPASVLPPSDGSPSPAAPSTLAVSPVPPAAQEPESKAVPWPEFVKDATDAQIEARLTEELREIVKEFTVELRPFCFLSLYDPVDTIDSWESDRIYTALQYANADHEKDVFLLLLSRGGQIEPAYQISKVCRSFSKQKFVVAIPRAAKSAATLIALGADEIHMGMLGALGPIDPQIGDLPALGVKRALETIASVCEDHPGSSQAFSEYMAKKLTVEQIGYCERVAESAVQYAQRLLAKKRALSTRAEAIAKQLVYEYKDHGFVIDVEEARSLLDANLVRTATPEARLAEKLHQRLEIVNMYLGIRRERHLAVVGILDTDFFIRRR